VVPAEDPISIGRRNTNLTETPHRMTGSKKP
jgi:hypothetical protein